jgi:proline racemase
VAFAQSKVGDTLAHVSVIGTSFQRIACKLYASGDNSKVTLNRLYEA